MDKNDDKELSLDAQDVHTQIAAIEAEADHLAQKNKVPEEIAAAKQEAAEYRAAEQKEVKTEKKREFTRLHKWLIGIFAGLLVALVIAWFVPATRHAALNKLGVRDSIYVSGAQAPTSGSKVSPEIKNFRVTIDSQEYESGDKSQITIPAQTFGRHIVTVAKAGYAPTERQVNLTFDPFFGLLGKKEIVNIKALLQAKGLPVVFTAKDWTSKLPITEGEFTFGDVTARPDKDGKVSLIVPPTSEKEVAVKAEFSKEYLGKSFQVAVNGEGQDILFVPSGKHYFVSKRSGVYSIYSSHIDGSDLKEVVKGTNQETSSLQFAVSPSGKYGVMTSTRDGRRDTNGNLMQRLYWVNLSSGKLEEMDTATHFNLRDWSGETIVYSYAYQDETSGEPKQRLRSLDVTTRNQYELSSTTGYFDYVYVSDGMAVYTKQEGFNKPGFEKQQTIHMVGIKGDNARELATNIGEVRQLGFDRFAYQTPDNKWNELTVGTNQIKSVEPPHEQGAVYISTQNSSKERIFINFVDGKRILMLQQKDGKTKELATQPGLSGPIRFLNDSTIVYRVVTPTETADYAVSTRGGAPQKVTDVTASSYSTRVFFQYY